MTEIDVSGCEFKSCFDDECYSDVNSTENLNCKDNPNCYYRQLKRLEVENAKLKEENFKLGQIDIKKVTLVENRQLEEENKKLKEKLKTIKEIVEECSLHNACISDCAYFEHCDGCVTNLFLQIIEVVEDD